MTWPKIAVAVCMVVFLAGSSFAWDAKNRPPLAKNRNPEAAMWLSIAHPGLGEWYNAGWGGWGNCNQRTFWMGLIPGYGWPGYLQVKSAINAKRNGTW